MVESTSGVYLAPITDCRLVPCFPTGILVYLCNASFKKIESKTDYVSHMFIPEWRTLGPTVASGAN